MEEQKNKKQYIWMFLGGVIGIFLAFYLLDFEDEQTKTTPKEALSIRRSGKIEKNYGFQSESAGTKKQSRWLLDEIGKNPDKNEYKIFYNTNDEIIIFGCDFGRDIIIRMKTRPNGHGTAEKWAGDIMYRLQTATVNGSLNDTVNGKSYGTFDSF